MAVTAFCTDGVIKAEFALDDIAGLHEFLAALPKSCYHVNITRR